MLQNCEIAQTGTQTPPLTTHRCRLHPSDLRPIRFHDLRHSCATIMLYFGYTMKDIQTWLGHSNYNFTADTYVHSSPAMHIEMAKTYSDRLTEMLPPLQIGPPEE